ncbi:hypothetical protein OSB04_002544 [Centaurea solstitialis]|uniref:Uncharacterized protein n=1 Tax=Centaurea solstitialis TaxID=347529 RepID=A0AA38TT32_9ASTR|nr:hypothetical protein OSB04_002544 [Centaurea solstitialis]
MELDFRVIEDYIRVTIGVCGTWHKRLYKDPVYENDLGRVPERSNLDVKKIWWTKVAFLEMVKDMRAKYDKDWGAYDKLNDFMYFEVLK